MSNQKHTILLFDGICNLCNSVVIFIIKRDKRKQIRYAPLQSDIGKALLVKYQLKTNFDNSLVFIDNNKVYLKSSGALRLSIYLKGLWPLFYPLIFLPRFIRDKGYDIIARNRYRWFGKREKCMVPSAQMKVFFLTYEYEI